MSEGRPRRRIIRKKKKKGLPIFKILLLVLVIIFGFFVYRYFLSGEFATGYYTIAVFGVDSRDGNLDKGALADVNMIANINRETGEVQLVSVYRDLYSQIDEDGTYHKLNEAYFKGGAEQGMAALERNLDINIDDYATFNWKAVVDAINILGGIDLEISDAEFKYINSFITETVEATGVGSHHLKSAGMNHLDGVQAVAYARLRLMDTDFKRTERQRKVVSLAFEKAKQVDFATLNNIMVTILPQISTSVTLDDMIPFARNISKYHLGTTTGFPFEKTGKTIHRRDYVIPVNLKANVIALHELLYGISGYTPSAGLVKISNKIIKDTGIGADGTEVNVNSDTPKSNSGSSSGSGNNTNVPASEGVTETLQSVEETTESITETEETLENETTESTVENEESSTTSTIKATEETTGTEENFGKENVISNTTASEETAEIGPGR